MIKVTYRKRGIYITQIWFADDKSSVDMEERTDILFFHGLSRKEVQKHSFSCEFHTLITMLQVPEEELLGHINKNVRYEIRRNIKENVVCQQFEAKDLAENPMTIDMFANMYERMYREKGQKVAFNRVQFQKYIREDAVVLTAIYREKEPLVFHSYIVGEKQVRLLHSVSDFRDRDMDANLVARANKRLHWEDIKWFKNKGKEIYDWGGVSSLQNPNGIDSFKHKFGGFPLTYYNVYVGNSLLGKIIVSFLKWKNGKSNEKKECNVDGTSA